GLARQRQLRERVPRRGRQQHLGDHRDHGDQQRVDEVQHEVGRGDRPHIVPRREPAGTRAVGGHADRLDGDQQHERHRHDVQGAHHEAESRIDPPPALGPRGPCAPELRGRGPLSWREIDMDAHASSIRVVRRLCAARRRMETTTTAENIITEIAVASPMLPALNAASYIWNTSVRVALTGPPSVITYDWVNICSPPRNQVTTTNSSVFDGCGRGMRKKRCTAPAPSICAASSISVETDWIPASRMIMKYPRLRQIDIAMIEGMARWESVRKLTGPRDSASSRPLIGPFSGSYSRFQMSATTT